MSELAWVPWRSAVLHTGAYMDRFIIDGMSELAPGPLIWESSGFPPSSNTPRNLVHEIVEGTSALKGARHKGVPDDKVHCEVGRRHVSILRVGSILLGLFQVTCGATGSCMDRGF